MLPVLLEPQLLDIMIVQFRNEKVTNHGSIPITIDCNVVVFIVFEEGFHQPIKCTKQSRRGFKELHPRPIKRGRALSPPPRGAGIEFQSHYALRDSEKRAQLFSLGVETDQPENGRIKIFVWEASLTQISLIRSFWWKSSHLGEAVGFLAMMS
ncbi:hypothetical protein TNCV_4819091 [Trichonephila clavipes]|nr:hypothetical protein TNCV_4819091 [Trichonephila clavipes]